MYAVVDIETTGSHFGEDRITEIAIVLYDGKKITKEWSTLVNPQTIIDPYVSRLTGIDEALVEDAPLFEEVAAQILELTKDCIFVAHNVGFDYHFLRREMERIDLEFKRKRLCTVRLSRKLIPDMPSYSLGKLCDSLGIPLTDRHRAFGDARATALLMGIIIERDERRSKSVIQRMLHRNSQERNLPPNLPKETYKQLPEKPGVYYFHNRKGKVIYVGKAKNIKRRVSNHFGSAERRAKSANMRNGIWDITYELTGNDFVALLLESLEIKRLLPHFNRAQRQWHINYGLIEYTDQNGYHRLGIEKATRNKRCIITFPDFASARNYMKGKTREFTLCPRFTGIQTTKGACYDHKVGECKGACAGKEKPARYNKRVAKALASFDNEFENLLIIGEGRDRDEISVVGVENGHYLGYGFIHRDFANGDLETLKDCIKHQPDNPDIQRILHAWLRSNLNEKTLGSTVLAY